MCRSLGDGCCADGGAGRGRPGDALSAPWAGYLRDWDRTLRAGNYPETTRYNYLLAAAQLARYLAEYSPDL
ncbi:hypothetical protein [Micromonospora sp. B9E7]|uniref:hypothetical protein n=1 Tax=Micromonospora sp. B9E7 TaxID=3153574 RepID=UPI00325E8D2F